MNLQKSPISLCIVVVCLTLMASMAPAEPEAAPVLISNVWVETSIKTALSDLALASGYTIIPDKDLEGTVSLELTDVPFLEALYRVTIGCGAVYREIADGVYLVGPPPPPSATFDTLATTEIASLDYYTADEIFKQLPLHLQSYVRQGIDQLVVTAPSPLLERIKSIIQEIDTAPVQVVIEAVVLELSEDAAKNIGIEAFVGEALEKKQGQTEMSFFDMLGTLQTGEAVYTLGKIRGKIGELEVGIEALVERGDAKIHANPRILTSEGRTAELQAGSDVYVSILTGSLNWQYAQLQEVRVGVLLNVTPHVAKNGEITLDIVPEVSGIVDASSRQISNVNLEVTVRRVKTQARVQSGETIVIGGLLQELSTQTRTKVPFLGDLPIVGPVFRSKRTRKTKTELVILITPYIYTGNTDGKPASTLMQGLIKDVTDHKVQESQELRRRESRTTIPDPGEEIRKRQIERRPKPLNRWKIYPE